MTKTHMQYGELRETLSGQGLPGVAIDHIIRELEERAWLTHRDKEEPTDYAYEDSQDWSMTDRK